MSKGKWITEDEAIAHIMKTTGKTRRQARFALAAEVAKGTLPATAIDPKTGKRVKLPKEEARAAMGVGPQPLSPKQAVALMEQDPSMVLMPLADFLRGLSTEELLGELRSGRLIAMGFDETWQAMSRVSSGLPQDREITVSNFTVAMSRVIEWMTNPETPPHLLEQFRQGIHRTPS
jgi:hypothetical protein